MADHDNHGPVPLSHAQRQIWLDEQLIQNASPYNVPIATRLTGPLDRGALAQALSEVVRRHEILRTRYILRGGEPYQEVTRAEPADVTVAEPGHDWLATLRAEAARPFDLARGPVIRFLLMRNGPDDHTVMLTLHHIAADGRSLDIVTQEIEQLYGVFAAGRPAALPPPQSQYRDVASAERGRDAALTEKLRQSCDRLSEAQPVRLPRPWNGPATARRAVWLASPLDAAVLDDLRRLARGNRATFFMVALAAAFATLHLHLRSNDLVIGCVADTRDRAQARDLVGTFANMVPVRALVRGDPSFRELLAHVREQFIDALRYRDVPYDLLVREWRSQGNDLAGEALITATIDVLGPPPVIRLPGLSANPVDIDLGDAKFGLDLIIEDTSAPRALVHYDTAMLDDVAAAWLQQVFAAVLSNSASNPDAPLSRIAPAAATAVPAARLGQPPRHQADMALAPELVDRQIEVHPNRLALVCGSRRLRYRELGAAVSILAAELRRKGATTGTVIGVCLSREAMLPAAMLATWRVGGTYLPLDPDNPPARIAETVRSAGATIIITRAGHRELFPLVPVVTVEDAEREHDRTDPSGRDHIDQPTRRPATHIRPQDAAYIIFTSGSTGRPKGVVIEHRQLAATLAAWRDDFGLDEREPPVHLQAAPVSFDVAVGDVVRTLSVGGTIVTCPVAALLDPPELLALMRRERVDSAEFVPSVFRGLLAHIEEIDGTLSFFRLLSIGSDTWRGAEYRRAQRRCGPHTRLVSSYGLTECTIDNALFDGELPPEHDALPVPLGRPMSSCEMAVLDAALVPVPPGTPGDLYVAGPVLARGYLHDPAATASRFLPCSWNPAAGRMYATGDRARQRPDGTLEFLGRADHQVKIRGVRVEPGEVEAALGRHPAVDQVVTVVTGTTSDDRALHAYVTTRGPGAAPDELRSFLRSVLPAPLVPASVTILAAMPLTSHGKVDHKRLPAPVRATAPAPVASHDAELLTVLAAMAELIGPDPGPDDDFFDLGGHSMLAVHLASQLRARLDVPVTALEVMQRRTPRSLAALIEERVSARRTVVSKPPARAPAAALDTVLVTGGTGGVGSFVIRELLGRGRRVRVLARPESARQPLPADVEAVVGDLASPQSLAAAVRGVGAVIHTACTFTTPAVDVAATRVLARSASAGPFVFVSSVDVYGYGEHSDLLITESTPPAPPVSDYGRGKRLSEQHVLGAFGARTRASAVRAPLVWGPHQRLRDQLRWGATGAMFQAVMHGRPVVLPDPAASPYRWYGLAWVDATVLAQILVDCLDAPLNGPVNAISGHVSGQEFVAELARLLGSASEVELSEQAARAMTGLAQPWRYGTQDPGIAAKAQSGPDWRAALAAMLTEDSSTRR